MLPRFSLPIPGKKSQEFLFKLKENESRNVTFMDKSWPICIKKSKGVNVWDVDGNCFIDLTSFFGVSSLGHSPKFLEKIFQENRFLIHGVGDVHPNLPKIQLCEKLSELTYGRWEGSKGKVILANSGSEAIEIALKTAFLSTQKAGILTFESSYHGLTYGSLQATGIKKFRQPFLNQLPSLQEILPFPQEEESLSSLKTRLRELDSHLFGALVIEPLQARGGMRVPSRDLLPFLRKWCNENQVILIFDEIYTGLGRTGKFFACEWESTVPDIICLGKALTAGMPLSACVGKEEIMNDWPLSEGEALHTSTYLGHPLSCAFALASLEQYTDALFERVQFLGKRIQTTWSEISSFPIRGKGLMWGIETQKKGLGFLLAKRLLQKGILALPSGEQSEILALAPPFPIEEKEIDFCLKIISKLLEK